MNCNLFFKLSDNELVHNFSSVIRMLVASCRAVAKISFLTVTPVEKLANISANIVLNGKLSSGMVADELFNI